MASVGEATAVGSACPAHLLFMTPHPNRRPPQETTLEELLAAIDVLSARLDALPTSDAPPPSPISAPGVATGGSVPTVAIYAHSGSYVAVSSAHDWGAAAMAIPTAPSAAIPTRWTRLWRIGGIIAILGAGAEVVDAIPIVLQLLG